MTTLVQPVRHMFSAEAGAPVVICRMVLFGVAAASMLSIADLWFPGYDALEEVGLVALLTVMELGRRGFKQCSTSQSKGCKQTQAAHWPSKAAFAQTFSKIASVAPCNVERSESLLDAEHANLYYRSLQAATKAADVPAAEVAMQSMREAGIAPSIACYGILVGVCAKTGDVA
eukprot:CAMPEP_0172894606 /NCGR_PEP_ID=MMETSP1075-20121228/151277_1 /TAXON_ID=2916 /ORGANISM="Ceratium fusus, Strain PA161109" /LENGTH=172 /DNA_ID=CAMNT_0013749659 /DNA_START=42 /DNA_END=556 /DNA_ORIENTATION=+